VDSNPMLGPNCMAKNKKPNLDMSTKEYFLVVLVLKKFATSIGGLAYFHPSDIFLGDEIEI